MLLKTKINTIKFNRKIDIVQMFINLTKEKFFGIIFLFLNSV